MKQPNKFCRFASFKRSIERGQILMEQWHEEGKKGRREDLTRGDQNCCAMKKK